MKILKVFLLLLVAFPALAQEDESDMIQADSKAQQRIRAAHAAYITDRLGLTPEEAEKFWPVYREYAQKRRALRLSYNNAKRSGQDEKTLLDLDLKIKQQQLDLEKDYSGKLLKIITPEKMMNLRQAEIDFRKLIFQQIQRRQQQQELRNRPRLRPGNN
jgi:hypothetical protein